MARSEYCAVLMAIAVGLGIAQLPLAAQSALHCPDLVSIPGGSNPGDAPVHRCRLINIPRIKTSLEHFPAPMYAQRAGGDLTVIVDENGRVDQQLTRYWSVIAAGDDTFDDAFLAGLKSARFEVGMLNSGPARYGFRLAVTTQIRNDTVPQRIVWRYVQGVSGDSMIGDWIRTDPDPLHTSDQVDEVVRQVTKQLVDMQVLLPALAYCIIAPTPSAQAATSEALYRDEMQRARSLHVTAVPCTHDVAERRFKIEMPIQSGGGRTVVHASGDFLQKWPSGLDGRSWLAWEAYCVVPTAGAWANRTRCSVSPLYSGVGSIDGWGQQMFSDTSAKAPIQIAVEVTTRGAYWTDTIKATVPAIPRLEERAAMIHNVKVCKGAVWTMFADSIIDTERVAWFEVSGDPPLAGWLHVTPVSKRPANYEFHGCAASPSHRSVAAFLLPTLGRVPDQPVEFCYNVDKCEQNAFIDPDKHVLAPGPAASFKFSQLRPLAMTGEQYSIRVHLNREVEGLVVIAVFRLNQEAAAFTLSRRSGRHHDHQVHHTPPFDKDTTVDIYLATVGRQD